MAPLRSIIPGAVLPRAVLRRAVLSRGVLVPAVLPGGVLVPGEDRPAVSGWAAAARGFAMTLVVAGAVSGCGSSQPDNAALLSAIRDGQRAEVTVTGTVATLEPDATGRHGPHERFLLSVAGATVEVDHNLDLAPRVPLQVGEPVTVHGQFEPDPGHPVIHDTHHATGSHEGGWIDAAGQRYE